jgi:DNA-directed RNA polymerase III subunit RPC6
MADISNLKTSLYDLCKDDGPGQMYRQSDLLDLGVIPNNDMSTLLKVTQALVDEKLFKMVHDGSNIAWVARSEADAQK